MTASKLVEYNQKENRVLSVLIELGTGHCGFYGDVYVGHFGTEQYQIMPSGSNDRQVEAKFEGFWDWHLEQNHQWFDSPALAASKYLIAFDKWAGSEHCNLEAGSLHQDWQKHHADARILINALRQRFLPHTSARLYSSWLDICRFLGISAYYTKRPLLWGLNSPYRVFLGQDWVCQKSSLSDVRRWIRDNPDIQVEEKKEVMVKFFKDDKAFAIQTDAQDERDFTQDFATALEDYITGDKYEGQHELVKWLAGYAEVCCKMRGYKADVKEQRLITYGDVNPAADALVTSVDHGTQMLKAVA